MCERINIVLLIFYTSFVLYAFANTYGKFNFLTIGTRTCVGSLRKDCGYFAHTIQPGGHILDVYHVVDNDTYVDMIHVTAYKMELGESSPAIINMRLGKPCDSPMIRAGVKTWIGSGRSCLIKRGKYNYTLNLSALAQNLWGGSFFYGNFTFKSLISSQKCTVGCSMINVTFTPKHK